MIVQLENPFSEHECTSMGKWIRSVTNQASASLHLLLLLKMKRKTVHLHYCLLACVIYLICMVEDGYFTSKFIFSFFALSSLQGSVISHQLLFATELVLAMLQQDRCLYILFAINPETSDVDIPLLVSPDCDQTVTILQSFLTPCLMN